MFGICGRAYIYFIYGNYYCFNIVAKNYDYTAGAILIRAIQPMEGVNLMKIFRGTENILNLASGPGKITQAFKISKKHNGIDITDNKNDFLYLDEIDSKKEKDKTNKFKVLETRRIGITNALDKKWRFIMLNAKEAEKKNIETEFMPNLFISNKLFNDTSSQEK